MGDLPNSPQPNIPAAAPDAALMSAKRWTMVLLPGLAGLTSGLLMRLLRLVQHLSFSYFTGDFLTEVRNTSGGQVINLAELDMRAITTGIVPAELRLVWPDRNTSHRPTGA